MYRSCPESKEIEMKYIRLEMTMAQEVQSLFYNTFNDSEGNEEAKSVSGLVKNYLKNYPREDLKSFVALESDQIVGCVFFSLLHYSESDKKVFILSPMAVKTSFQGKGIGQALIKFAHNKLREEGVNITTTYGDINFYSKIGYELVKEESIAAPLKLTYPEGWLAHSLDGITRLKIEGPSHCIPELNDESLW